MESKNNAQWTIITMHNANKNNIMATITIWNVTIHNDYNEQNNTMNMNNEQWTMNNEQWTIMVNNNKNDNDQ